MRSCPNCPCGACCDRRMHFDTEDDARDEARFRWVVSRARCHVRRCPGCHRWFVGVGRGADR